jgi:UDP-N-acetylmuramoyl-L-alanyl-D-glutamate--2,6-diaminopimelate ligase
MTAAQMRNTTRAACARRGLCRHEGRLDRRQSLRRKGHRRRRARHHHRLAQTFDHLLVYQPGLPGPGSRARPPRARQASAAFFGHPERKLAATGITGTNGKTTTAFLTEALLNAAARRPSWSGRSNITWPAKCALVHTTPESRDLFELMAEGAARGATELVTEVSSHALDQGRA